MFLLLFVINTFLLHLLQFHRSCQSALTEAGLINLQTITKLIIKLSATLVGSQLQTALPQPHDKTRKV